MNSAAPVAAAGAAIAAEGAGAGPEAADRSRRLGTAVTILLLLAAAACRWFAFNPPAAPPLAVAWLAIASIAAIRARSAPLLLGAAFAIDFAWWLGVQRWVAEVSRLGYPFLSGYLALWGVVFVWLVRRIALRPTADRVPLWLTLPAIVVALDFLRGEIVFGGYPWYEAGQAFAGWSMAAQSADLLGARGLTILAAIFAGAVAELARPRSQGVRSLLRAMPILVAVAIGVLAYGSWRLQQAASLPTLGRFLAIQTALPIDNKIGWSPQRQVEDVSAFAGLTLSAIDAAGTPIDLVAWPETMLPGFGLDPRTLAMLEEGSFFPGRFFGEIAHGIAVESGVPLLVGSPVYEGLRADGGRWAWDRHFNSVYLVPPSPIGDSEPPRYDKLVLTPFGETMPGISRFKWLEERLLDLGARGMRFDLSAGESPVRFEVGSSRGKPIRIATPICFEATVAWLCRRLVWPEGERAADLLVNASNDGWLGDDRNARGMHLRLASLRAIETRTPMLRAVNTGFSAGIDSSGRVVAGLDGGASVGMEAGWVVAELPRDERRPLFARVGDRWAWLAVAGTLWLLHRSRRRSGVATGR